MFQKMNNEKGIALITALLVLSILTLLGLLATLTSSTDIKIAGNEKLGTQGQYASEAGIEHMQVFLNKTTNLEPSPAPVWAGAGTTSDFATFASWHPRVKRNIMDGVNVFSTYSATVSFKAVASGKKYYGKVAFYNQSSGYSAAPSGGGGWPVYVITSVARSGNYLSQRNILEVTKNSKDFAVRGGLTAGGGLNFNGNPTISGVHHDENGVEVATGSGCRDADLSQPMPATFSNGTTISGGSTNIFASPGVADATTRSTNVPSTPWGALGIPYDGKPGEDFVSTFPTGSWPVEFTGSGSFTGDRYYKDDDKSGSDGFSNEDITGSGLLVIHNPLFTPGLCTCIDGTTPGYPDCWNAASAVSDADCAAVNAPAVLDANGGVFRGLIIADQISLRGNVEIIGGLVSLTTIHTAQAAAGGNPKILYSCSAIERYAGGQVNRKLNWHKE